MKTTNVKSYLTTIALASCIGLTACKPKETIVEKNEQRVSVNDKMNSDELTAAAEQLVGPYTFMLAYKTATLALEKDPTNLKAQFYVKYLKRFEVFRGGMVRIKPLLKPEDRARHEENIRNFPNSPMKTFLMDNSKPVMNTIADAQAALGEYFAAGVEFRKFLKDNQNSQLELYLNPHVFEQKIKENLADSCQYTQKPDGYDVVCDTTTVGSVKLNMADLITLRQMTSAEILYSFFNSYSLSGLEKLKDFDPHGQKSNRERTEFLAALPGFGKLNSFQTITLMKDLGSDLTASLKWAVQYQNTLCPKGIDSRNQRRGYLFKDGICIDQADAAQKFISTMERALNGATSFEVTSTDGSKINLNLNIFAWSEKLVQDLRQIKPTAWNQCDRATALVDNSFGGIFVDNNVSVLLDTHCK